MDAPVRPAPALALALADLACAPHFRVGPVLALIEHLVGTGAVSLATPVETSEEGGAAIDGTSTLAQALLRPHSPGHYAPSLYTPATARRLLALAPDFFHARPAGANGGWWVWDHLEGWADQPDRDRMGFAPPAADPDGWAAAVIDSLPDAAFAHPSAQAGWQALLRMGLGQACAAFAARVPGQWLRRTRRKGAVAFQVQEARSGAVFEAMLAAGIDPLERLDASAKGRASARQPLWRLLLPARSRAAPTPGTFRAAVEDWASQAIDSQHPDYPALVRCKAEWIVGWLTASTAAQPRQSRSRTRTAPDWSSALKRLHAEPVGWIAAVAADRPAWLLPLFNRAPDLIKPEAWARAVAGLAPWRAQAGALADVVAALFDTPDPQQVPSQAWKALCGEKDPNHRQWLEEMAQHNVWGPRGPTVDQILAVFDHYWLEQTLPGSDPAPRLRM